MCCLISSDNKNSQSCACGNLRKTTRTITQFYDKMLKPTGLTEYSMFVIAGYFL